MFLELISKLGGVVLSSNVVVVLSNVVAVPPSSCVRVSKSILPLLVKKGNLFNICRALLFGKLDADFAIVTLVFLDNVKSLLFALNPILVFVRISSSSKPVTLEVC